MSFSIVRVCVCVCIRQGDVKERLAGDFPKTAMQCNKTWRPLLFIFQTASVWQERHRVFFLFLLSLSPVTLSGIFFSFQVNNTH